MHPVLVNQSTSGLMEEVRVHSNTWNAGPKSRLPNIAGNSPRGAKLSYPTAKRDPTQAGVAGLAARLSIIMSWNPSDPNVESARVHKA